MRMMVVMVMMILIPSHSQKDKKTKRQKDNKTKRQKDKNSNSIVTLCPAGWKSSSLATCTYASSSLHTPPSITQYLACLVGNVKDELKHSHLFRWHSSTSKNVHIFYLKCSEKCSKQKVSLLSIIGWSQSAVDGRCICCVGGVDGIFICGAITWEPATSQESHLPTLVANAVNHSWKSEQT